MTEKTGRYLFENHLARTKHETLWADGGFASYALETYGSERKLFDQLASVIRLGNSFDAIAYSLPTGGRVVFYPLRKPFFHRQTGKTINYVDVKGVGLTASGYHFGKRGLSGNSHLEIMTDGSSDYPFGPLIAEGTDDAMSLIDDLSYAIKHGFTPPPPLALFRAKKLYLHGLPIDPREITDPYGYRKKGDFPVLLVRGYEDLPARISDELLWDNHGVDSPNYVGDISPTIIQIGRDRWSLHYENLPKQNRPTRNQIFDQITQLLFWQTKQMMLKNISPASGNENMSALTRHTHLQNYTLFSASLVEWSPLIKKTDLVTAGYHYRSLIASAYDAYINLGALILPTTDWKNCLLSCHQFAWRVTWGLRSRNENVNWAYEEFLPENALSVAKNGEALYRYLTGHC